VATIGRRKTAVARAYVKSGEGNITINGLPHSDYFSRETSIMVLEQPLQILNKRKDYDIKINVIGGGKSGQAGACRLAIARALNDLNGEDRSALKKEGFLTRD
ncbi:UNVERIFIED_CONTAM: hypothetical protein GTU68_005682, partial [Idotea baltica]|nr:hypothetical protein [Idotea baltica]